MLPIKNLTKATLLLTATASMVACNTANEKEVAHPSTPHLSEQADMAHAAEIRTHETNQRKKQDASGLPALKIQVQAVQQPLGIRSLPPQRHVSHEKYAEIKSNGIKRVAETPVSTFSIDVDSASYANVRRLLQQGQLPQHNAVRIEELLNYFNYQDPAPSDKQQPFLVSHEIAPSPWNTNTHLLKIALKAWQAPMSDLPPSNLVFLIDVSGSMSQANKLPLLKRSIKLLTKRMRSQDRISIVVYAGASGVALEPTAGNQQATIELALEKLSAGGSTHGSAGIQLAYAKAKENFIEEGINRVILATDGDFNVGTVNHDALINLIEEKRKSGIYLTTLGFGRGNYNDKLMEQLADHGNGNYAYIDSLLEAQKVLVEQAGSTLLTIAKDVKIQVEFNPNTVDDYRLIGYENRVLAREDFNNDKVDAGELGAGHSVVALYELHLKGAENKAIDALRYASKATPVQKDSDELAYVKLRYKLPKEDKSTLLSTPIKTSTVRTKLSQASDDFRFAAAVAGFAQQLRGGKHLGDFSYPEILTLARDARGNDAQGYRSGFLRIVSLADSLSVTQQPIALNSRERNQ